MRLIILALLIAAPAYAADVDAPLTGGTIEVHYGSASSNPDALQTVSIGVRTVIGKNFVFCMDVDSAGEVSGTTDIVPAIEATVLLEGVAYSESGCFGVPSLPSADHYRLIFAGPGPPILIPN